MVISYHMELSDDEEKFLSGNAKFFQSIEWAKFNNKSGKHSKTTPMWIFIKEQNEYVGSWLIFINELNLFAFKFSEIAIATEPTISIKDEIWKNETIKQLIEGLIRFSTDNSIFRITFGTNMTNWTDYKLLIGKFEKIDIMDFGTYILDFSSSLDEIWKKMSKKKRNMIRKAKKNGLEVKKSPKIEKDIITFYEMQKETYARSNKKGFKLNYIKSILNLKDSDLFFTQKDDKLLASAIMMGNKKQVYYLHGASIQNSFGASDILQWRMIEYYKEEGYKYYDFGGVAFDSTNNTKSEGIKHFKKSFGGDFLHTYRAVIILSPVRNQIYNAIGKLYSIFIRGYND